MTRLHDIANRWSQPYRTRLGGDIFLHGHTRPVDRLVSRIYFEIDAVSWREMGDLDAHLSSYTAGLSALGREPRVAVDAGTGAGGSAVALARRFPAAQVIAVDTAWGMLRQARRSNPAPNLTYRRCSVTDLPCDDRSVDTVTALNAIVSVEEIRRVATSDVQVLMASTFFPVRDDESDWVQRWRKGGFARTRAEPAAVGSWEIYRLVSDH